MTIHVIKSVWTGGPSAPGITQFVVRDTGAVNFGGALAAVRQFWEDCKGGLPVNHQITVLPQIDTYSEQSGTLTGTTTYSPAPAPTNGANAGPWAAGVGVRVDWDTDAINRGRRVSGRTYLVPYATANFDTDGSVVETVRSGLLGFAQAFIASMQTNQAPLCIWSRPSTAYPVGAIHEVADAKIPDKAAILRSRRDP